MALFKALVRAIGVPGVAVLGVLGLAVIIGAISMASGGSREAEGSALTGRIVVDGSSTVYPITQIAAEVFNDAYPNVNITVGFSGTGGGFKKFAAGETDISNASRPIKATEVQKFEDQGERFIEVPVAYDGLTIVVHPNNTWVKQFTVDQLKLIFLASNKDKIKTWQDLNPDWPDEAIKMFIPGTDSGTFDYFKEVVVGKTEDGIREDVSESENDDTLVNGLEGSRYSIGFFGAAYYFENQDKIKAVPIINKDGEPVLPTAESIESGQYNPFSRPLMIYVKASSLERPEVAAFVEYYLDDAGEFSEQVGYVALPDEVYRRARANIRTLRTGSQYLDENGNKIEGPVTEVYR